MYRHVTILRVLRIVGKTFSEFLTTKILGLGSVAALE